MVNKLAGVELASREACERGLAQFCCRKGLLMAGFFWERHNDTAFNEMAKSYGAKSYRHKSDSSKLKGKESLQFNTKILYWFLPDFLIK